MVLNYKECIELFGSHYLLMKAISNKEIFKIENGIYSSVRNPKDMEVFLKKHPQTIFTMESALYYLGISDVIPDKYVVSTDTDGTKYKETNIKQYFIKNELLNIGSIDYVYLNIKIKLYSKERMLIEVIRYKNKLPYDYYKDIISFYRNNIDSIDIPLVLEYINLFPKSQSIKAILASEVL